MGADVDVICVTACRHSRQERTSRPKGARAPLATPSLAPPERAVPKPRTGSSFPNWVRARRRRARGGPEQLLATCLRARVSTRRLAQLACALGIAEPSKSQVTEMAHGLDAAVRALRTRPLDGGRYSIISPDTLVVTVREAGRTVHVLVTTGVNVRKVTASSSVPGSPTARTRPAGHELLALDRGTRVVLVIAGAHQHLT
jgi:putative transposase